MLLVGIKAVKYKLPFLFSSSQSTGVQHAGTNWAVKQHSTSIVSAHDNLQHKQTELVLQDRACRTTET